MFCATRVWIELQNEYLSQFWNRTNSYLSNVRQITQFFYYWLKKNLKFFLIKLISSIACKWLVKKKYLITFFIYSCLALDVHIVLFFLRKKNEQDRDLHNFLINFFIKSGLRALFLKSVLVTFWSNISTLRYLVFQIMRNTISYFFFAKHHVWTFLNVNYVCERKKK